MDNKEAGIDKVGQLKKGITDLVFDYNKLKESPSQLKDKGPGMDKLRERANALLGEIKANFTSRVGLTHEGEGLNRQLVPVSAEIDADVAAIEAEVNPSEENAQKYSRAIDAVRIAKGLEPLKRG